MIRAIILALALAAAWSFTAMAHELMTGDGHTLDASKLRDAIGGSCCGNEHCRIVPAEVLRDGARLDLGDPWGKIFLPFDRFQPPLPEAPDVTVACWNQNIKTELRGYCFFLEAIQS